MATQTEILRIEVDNKQAQKDITDQTKKIEDLKDENKQLLAVNKKLAKEDRDTSKERARNSETIAKNAAVISKNTQQRKQNIGVLQSERKTLNNLRSQLALLTAERNKNLVVGSKAFNHANKQIASYNNQIRAGEEAGKDFRRSVGNYGRAFEGATASILPFNAALLASPIGLIAGALGALLLVVKQSFSFFKEFDTVMSKVRATTSATNEEFEKLRESTIEFGESSKFTATEVAQLQLELAKLGFTTQEIIDSTDAVLNLATATDSELGRAAEVVAQTLNQFNLEATESGRVADVMAKSFVSSGLDIEKFAEGMKNAGKASDLVGVTLEQTTAILAVLADNGVDSSTAGTQLKNVFIELSDKGLSWEDAMNRINKSQNKLTASNELFKKRGSIVGAVIAENVVKIDELTRSINDATDASAEMARIVGNNLQGDLDRLSSSWEGLIARGTFLNKTFRFITKSIKLMIDLVKDIPLVFERVSISIQSTFNSVQKSILDTVRKVAEFTGIEIDGVTKSLSDKLDKNSKDLEERGKAIDEKLLKRAKETNDGFASLAKEQEDQAKASRLRTAQDLLEISNLETEKEIENTKKLAKERQKAAQELAEAREEEAQKQRDATFELELWRKERAAQEITDADEKVKALIEIEKFKLDQELMNESLIETERELLIEQSLQRQLEIKQTARDEEQRQKDEAAAADKKREEEQTKKIETEEKEREDLKKQRVQNGLNLTQAAVGLASEILGKETKAGKALAITAAGINTLQAVTKTLATYGGTPVGYANATAVGLSGALQISKMKAIDASGGGVGGSISTPNVPTTSTQVDTSNVDSQVNQQEVLIAALESQRYSVSVTEINDVQNAVAVGELDSTI